MPDELPDSKTGGVGPADLGPDVFTPQEVHSLNEYQNAGVMHPFTCGGGHRGAHPDGEGILVATTKGWVCPYCDYRQNWAHVWMKDGAWKKTGACQIVDLLRERARHVSEVHEELMAAFVLVTGELIKTMPDHPEYEQAEALVKAGAMRSKLRAYGLLPADADDEARNAAIWDQINGRMNPWAANPWVWCISFRKLEAEARMILWLDDLRSPAAHGYIGARWAKTYEAAIAALQSGDVLFASLDHDIGACAACTEAGLHIGDMETPETTFLNTCPHSKTGYDVVCWMEEHNVWPSDGVHVHSMNPAGRSRMQQVIDRHYLGERS